MTKGVESELKYALDRESYGKLRRRFRGAGPVRQENHYFDDPRRLVCARRDIGVRIRLSPGKPAVLTVKAPAPGSRSLVKGHRVRRELEAKLTASQVRGLLAGSLSVGDLRLAPVRLLRQAIGPKNLAGLVHLGRSRNTRLKLELPSGLPLELDRFEVFGRIDYELEVESFDPRGAHREVRALFRSLGIPLRARHRSKLARFLTAYRRRARK